MDRMGRGIRCNCSGEIKDKQNGGGVVLKRSQTTDWDCLVAYRNTYLVSVGPLFGMVVYDVDRTFGRCWWLLLLFCFNVVFCGKCESQLGGERDAVAGAVLRAVGRKEPVLQQRHELPQHNLSHCHPATHRQT
jgi:hypothetical protein